MNEEKLMFKEKKIEIKEKKPEIKKNEKTIKLRYKKNNKYDLFVLRKYWTFLAYETKELPIEILKDKNWEWEKQFFQIVKE